jgi:hypothetical protein
MGEGGLVAHLDGVELECPAHGAHLSPGVDQLGRDELVCDWCGWTVTVDPPELEFVHCVREGEARHPGFSWSVPTDGQPDTLEEARMAVRYQRWNVLGAQMWLAYQEEELAALERRVAELGGDA